MHLQSVFTCCNCRKSGSKDMSAYFQVFFNSIATRKRAVLRRCNFQTIALKSLERETRGEKNKPETIPSLAFSLPSNKLTCLEQKRKYLVLLQAEALQAEMCCMHWPKEKGDCLTACRHCTICGLTCSRKSCSWSTGCYVGSPCLLLQGQSHKMWT